MGAQTSQLERTIPDTAKLSVRQIRDGLETRQFTCVDLVTTYIRRIHEINGKCHAVIAIHEEALKVAAERDKDIELGKPRGELHGVPVLLKDLFSIDNSLDTTAGSFALVGARLGKEATLVRRLRDAGAIILGTTNLSQWANFRSDNVPPGWSAVGGQCLGMHTELQNPAGSSAGSAVAARLGLAAACIGTENNGSITSPASRACCVGYKPTVGLVSRYGSWPANFYQDCPGPITRTVEDAAAILQVISGQDDHDSLTREIPVDIDLGFVEACVSKTLNGTSFAVPRKLISSTVKDQVVLENFEATLLLVEQAGAKLVDVDFPTWTPEYSVETIDFVWRQLGECINDYFSRLQSNPQKISSLDDLLSFTRSDPREKAAEYGVTRLVKAQQTISRPRFDTKGLFADRLAKGSEISVVLDASHCDAILVPVGCRNPSDLGQCPVACLPLGFYPPETERTVDKFGMTLNAPNVPFGLLMIGRKWSDAKLLALASAYEKIVQRRISSQAQPPTMPETELRDIVAARIGGRDRNKSRLKSLCASNSVTLGVIRRRNPTMTRDLYAS